MTGALSSEWWLRPASWSGCPELGSFCPYLPGLGRVGCPVVMAAEVS